MHPKRIVSLDPSMGFPIITQNLSLTMNKKLITYLLAAGLTSCQYNNPKYFKALNKTLTLPVPVSDTTSSTPASLSPSTAPSLSAPAAQLKSPVSLPTITDDMIQKVKDQPALASLLRTISKGKIHSIHEIDSSRCSTALQQAAGLSDQSIYQVLIQLGIK